MHTCVMHILCNHLLRLLKYIELWRNRTYDMSYHMTHMWAKSLKTLDLPHLRTYFLASNQAM